MANQDKDFYQELRNKFRTWAKTVDGKENGSITRLLQIPGIAGGRHEMGADLDAKHAKNSP